MAEPGRNRRPASTVGTDYTGDSPDDAVFPHLNATVRLNASRWRLRCAHVVHAVTISDRLIHACGYRRQCHEGFGTGGLRASSASPRHRQFSSQWSPLAIFFARALNAAAALK